MARGLWGVRREEKKVNIESTDEQVAAVGNWAHSY